MPTYERRLVNPTGVSFNVTNSVACSDRGLASTYANAGFTVATCGIKGSKYMISPRVPQGSPIYPGGQFMPMPQLPAPPGVNGGILDTFGSVTDLVCRYFPSLCNIATPGARFPTPDPRTPAPSPDFPGTREGVPANGQCAPGYHLNKGTYWTKQGVVYPQTRCVKNRRMNPLNPRALARSITRGGRFVKMAQSFGLKAPERGLKKRRRRC
jgi:hypothetical protein